MFSYVKENARNCNARKLIQLEYSKFAIFLVCLAQIQSHP